MSYFGVIVSKHKYNLMQNPSTSSYLLSIHLDREIYYKELACAITAALQGESASLSPKKVDVIVPVGAQRTEDHKK